MRAVLLAALTCAACMTSTTTSEPVGLDRAVITPVPADRAWVIEDRGAVVGSVVRYAEGAADGRFLYVVRNLWDQDLGMIDEDGRAWRRVPHADDRWISTGPVLDGVRRILGLGDAATMVEGTPAYVEATVRDAN